MAKGIDLSSNVALILSIIALLIAIEVAIVGLPTQSQEIISTTASGVAYGYPDQAVLYLVANATGLNAASAGANLSSIIDSLNSTIAPLVNHNMSLLQTESFTLNKQQITVCSSNSTAGSRAPIACMNTTIFVAAEGVTVRMPIGNVSSALIGVSNIDGISVQQAAQTFSDQYFGTLMAQALGSALENATDEAQVIAGTSQLQILNVTVQNYPLVYGPLASSASQGAGNIYFPGRGSVTRTVYVKFAVRQ